MGSRTGDIRRSCRQFHTIQRFRTERFVLFGRLVVAISRQVGAPLVEVVVVVIRMGFEMADQMSVRLMGGSVRAAK